MTCITCITYITFITSDSAAAAAEPEDPAVTPGYQIAFPADEGSHPSFRTEWWYVTGWLTDENGVERGFQVTFFRSRPGIDEQNPSRFAPTQLLFAHAAISDPARGRLLRAERSARAGFGLAEALEGRLGVHIDEWSLRKDDAVYRTSIVTNELAIELAFQASQPPILQGQNGFSQRGPDPRAASYYYSLPHLQATGELRVGSERFAVRGWAWLDHEWFNRLVDDATVGWDWVGINLDDGGAITAAQARSESGGEHWAAATWRPSSSDPTRSFEPHEVEWSPGRRWRSPRTGIEWPIAWRVTVGERTLTLEPLMDDQENDARGSTGSIYWEGAVRVLDERGARVGKGYLEMTGYERSDGVPK